MEKNTNRTIAITRRLVATFAAITISAFNVMPVHALSYSLGYLDNGDGTLYDEETGAYVDMDTYHAAYGYEYNADTDAYGYWNDGYFYTCNCTACNYWKEGHRIVVPGQENTEEASETQEENKTSVFMAGSELGENNLSGDGWSYDQTSGTLTLDSYTYEGTGLFAASEASSGNEDNSSEVDGEDADDEEWDDSDEADGEDEEWDDDTEEPSDDGSNDSETVEPVKGVIRSDGELTLNLNGVSRITVNDEGSDASYAVNVAGELKIEGDGVLYVKSATEEKVYGTEPADQNAAGNYGNINTNTNDIDNTQTVNEAPVTQNVDDGDVNVSNSNNVDMPDFSNSISLPGASNSITFNPTVEVKLPQNAVEKTVLSGLQQRHPELTGNSSQAQPQLGRCADAKPAYGDIKVSDATQADTSAVTVSADGAKSVAPQTGDSLDFGVLMALASVVIGGTTGGILLWRRIKGY